MLNRKTYAALALAGTLAVAAVTPSHADSRWGWAAGGFAAGAVVGAAAANANAGYYGGAYAYDPGYAYAPSYGAYAYSPGYATTYGYAPRTYTYSYRPNRAPNFDPVNGDDPDSRIGGSFKMNSSGDD
jgi:hypothetical protein